jgi:hypothetical protein
MKTGQWAIVLCWAGMIRSFMIALCLMMSPGMSWAQRAEVSAEQVARLIVLAEAGTADSEGWATDMLEGLRAHRLPVNRENVCSIIAIVDQESSFNPNPRVARLGALSEKAIRDKFEGIPIVGRMALNYLESHPTRETNFMKRIRSAKTERDLDLAYRALLKDTSQRASLDLVLRSGLFNQLVEDKNEIDTIGSMQVSVKFALDMNRRRRWLPMTLDDVYAVRDHLYTREGGMYYGIAQLLAYETGYTAKIFRFADYNAGRYASRNAAFQSALSRISGVELALDGDLLSYGKGGQALTKVSATEKAMREAAEQHGFGLDDRQIRKDFLLEKDAKLALTKSYAAVMQKAEERTQGTLPYALVPQITLQSLKIKGFTTERFAKAVNKRYQSCIATKI